MTGTPAHDAATAAKSPRRTPTSYRQRPPTPRCARRRPTASGRPRAGPVPAGRTRVPSCRWSCRRRRVGPSGAASFGAAEPARRAIPTIATRRPMAVEAVWEDPVLDRVSPYTAMPRITLEKRVTELLDAMAGARTPVLRDDCCNAKPLTADKTSTYTDQLLSERGHSAAELGDEGFRHRRLQSVPQACRGAEGSAFAAPVRRRPTANSTRSSAPVIRQADHQAPAPGWEVPPWGWPTDTKNTIPSSVSDVRSARAVLCAGRSTPRRGGASDHQAEGGEGLHHDEGRTIEGHRLKHPARRLEDGAGQPDGATQNLDQEPRVVRLSRGGERALLLEHRPARTGRPRRWRATPPCRTGYRDHTGVWWVRRNLLHAAVRTS